MKYKSVNYYTILVYIFKFAFLLIIPVMQQLIINVFIDKNKTIAIAPIVLIALVFLWGYLEYRAMGYSNEKNYFVLKKGVIIKKESRLLHSCIHSAQLKRTPLCAIFKGAKLELYTPARNRESNNVHLIINKQEAENVLDNIFNFKNEKIISKAKASRILLMSASWSNPIVSALIAIPFVKRAGVILGQEVNQRLYSTFDKTLSLLELGIPPAITTLTYLIIIAFVVALFLHFFKYINFTTLSNAEHIKTTRGFVNHREKIIRKSAINAIIIRQTLLMRIFNFYSAYIYTAGSSKDKSDHNLLFATMKRKELLPLMKEALGIDFDIKMGLRPQVNSIRKFIMTPLLALIAMLILIIVFIGDLWYKRIISLFIVFLSVLIFLILVVRYEAYKTSHVTLVDKLVVVSGYKMMSLYSAYIPKDKIQCAKLTQNIFLKRSNTCNLRINIYSEKRKYFECKYLNYNSIRKLIGNL